MRKRNPMARDLRVNPLYGGYASSAKIDDVLRDALAGRVACINGSALRAVGCMPHALTLTAQALATTRAVLAR